jgi:hypothetical protein
VRSERPAAQRERELKLKASRTASSSSSPSSPTTSSPSPPPTTGSDDDNKASTPSSLSGSGVRNQKASKKASQQDYHLVGADLRDVKELESMLIANGVDFRYYPLLDIL